MTADESQARGPSLAHAVPVVSMAPTLLPAALLSALRTSFLSLRPSVRLCFVFPSSSGKLSVAASFPGFVFAAASTEKGFSIPVVEI